MVPTEVADIARAIAKIADRPDDWTEFLNHAFSIFDDLKAAGWKIIKDNDDV